MTEQHLHTVNKEYLDSLVLKYNVPEFAAEDPVQFPRRYTDVRDIEISSLLTSTIAWGRRPMILRNAERLHSLLESQPYRFITEGDIEALPEDNIHRTFFGRHLKYYLRGLRELYSRYGSLENFAASIGAERTEAPAWEIAAALSAILRQANKDITLTGPDRCLPAQTQLSALKRFNMALRWLVRNDGIVDMGVWNILTPAQLYIPLDVHSGNTSRALGLITRKANDRRTVEELTAALRTFDPADPVKYDFALFGAGVNAQKSL